MRYVRALDRQRRVTALPFQQPGVPAANGLSVQQCEAAAWAITPEQRRLRGAAAINLTFAVIFRTWLPLWLYAQPWMQPLQDAAYKWIARNRSRFPGDQPYCEQFPDQCR